MNDSKPTVIRLLDVSGKHSEAICNGVYCDSQCNYFVESQFTADTPQWMIDMVAHRKFKCHLFNTTLKRGDGDKHSSALRCDKCVEAEGMFAQYGKLAE